MRIKTLEVLSDFLDEDLAWRKKELTYIDSLVQKSSPESVDTQIRIGVTILYAHWEGYIKNAGTYYINYVNQLGLKYENLSENFIAIALKNKIKEIGNSNKTSIHAELVRILISELSSIPEIPYKKTIKTDSNLKWEVFNEVLDTLGLDNSFYITKEKLIDIILVDNRNNIAHGNRLTVTQEEYKQLYIEVIKMIEYFKEQIIQAAINQLYLRNN